MDCIRDTTQYQYKFCYIHYIINKILEKSLYQIFQYKSSALVIINLAVKKKYYNANSISILDIIEGMIE